MTIYVAKVPTAEPSAPSVATTPTTTSDSRQFHLHKRIPDQALVNGRLVPAIMWQDRAGGPRSTGHCFRWNPDDGTGKMMRQCSHGLHHESRFLGVLLCQTSAAQLASCSSAARRQAMRDLINGGLEPERGHSPIPH